MARSIFLIGILLIAGIALLTRQAGGAFAYLYLAVIASLVVALWSLLAPALGSVWTWLKRPREVGRLKVVPSDVLIGVGVFAFFLACSIALFPKLAMGQRPVDHDHPVHFFKIWQLRELLSEGHLQGWSNRWFAGYPVNYLYPVGTNLVALGVWAAGFGHWSLDAAYAWTFLLFWTLQGYSTYLVGRAFLGRWVGLLAGTLVLIDEGAFRFGGWVFAGQWGVWPNSFAIAMGLVGVSFIPRIIEGKDRRAVVWFALWTGMSLMTHPLQFVHVGILCVVATIAVMTSDFRTSRTLGLTRLAVATALSMAISSVWLLPFLAFRKESQSFGEPWRNAYDMGVQLYYGKLFEGSWALVGFVGLIGTVALLRRRRFRPSFIALMVLFGTCGASIWFTTSFHLIHLSDAFAMLQFQRFAMITKPYFFIAAAVAVVRIFSYFERGVPSNLPRVFLVSLMGLPIAFGWADSLRRDQLIHGFSYAEGRPYASARKAIAAWLRADWEKRDVPFYRVATVSPRHDHAFADFGTELPMPHYKAGFMPAETFRYKPESSTPELLDALNVRYIVANRPMSKPYSLVKDFGEGLRLYAYDHWKKQPYVVEGDGKVELEQWSTERIVLKADKTAAGKLRLNVSAFPRWKATLNGAPLPIQKTSLPSDPKRTAFMTVDLRPGTYVFEFQRGTAEYLGLALSLLGLGVCGLLLLGASRVGGLGILEVPILHAISVIEDFDYARRPWVNNAAAVIFVAGAGLLFALASWTPPIEQTAGVTEVRYDFKEQLAAATVSRASKRCREFLGRHLCTKEEWGQIHPTSTKFGGAMRECVWAHPYKVGPLTLTYRHVPKGRLVTWFGVADTGTTNRPVDVIWSINGEPLFEGKTPRDGTTEAWTTLVPQNSEVTLQLTTRDQRTRHFCFAAQIVNEDATLLTK